MIRSFLIYQVVSILLLTGCSDPESGVTVNELRCENLSEPLGVGTTTPRFSWKNISERNGASQKAYQILVASDNNLLDEKNADLWNSGKVLSPTSVLVPYLGKGLTSRSLCFWKVRVWNENDKMSEWSNEAVFSIGLLDKSDWKAAYIGMPVNPGISISPQLRRTFTIPAKGDKVFLYINSLGYHEVFLNGEKVGDKVLTPAVSQFNKRSLVITYNISSLIRQGRNDIVLWIGQGWYSKGLPGVVTDGPVVKAQIEQLENGMWNTLLCTDASWLGRNSGYSTIGAWRPGRFGGERVDGSNILPDMSSESLDKTSWSPVYIAVIPDNEVTPQMTESNR